MANMALAHYYEECMTTDIPHIAVEKRQTNATSVANMANMALLTMRSVND